MTKSLFRRAVFLISLCPLAAWSASIVSDGRSDYRIVLPDTIPSEHVEYFLGQTAALLQRCVAEATGAELTVVRESSLPAEMPAIFLGATRAAMLRGVDAAALQGWEFRLKVADGNLFLVGRDEPGKRDIRHFAFHRLGTARAVTKFLQRFMDVRFVMPGPDGEAVPRREGLTVPDDLDVHDRPRIEFCTSRHKELFYDLANNFLPALDYGTHGGHSHDVAVAPERYGEDHPEYFALRNGKRLVSTGRPLHCLANPSVRELIYRELVDHADQGYKVVQLGQSDGFIGCQCEHCAKLFGIVQADDTREAYTDAWRERLWILHRKLVERFREDRPDKKVAILAYGPTRHPPESFRAFPENTIIELTRYADENFAEWNELEVPGGYYVYIKNWGRYQALGYTPKQTPEFIAAQVERFHANGVRGVYRCGFGELFGLEGPVYYLFGRLLGNPGLKTDEVLEEYCNRAYGAAAGPMTRFFGLLHERLNVEWGIDDWNDPDLIEGVHSPANQITRVVRARFPPEVMARLRGRLDEAETLVVPGSREATRLAVTRKEYDYLAATTEVLDAFTDYRGDPSPANFDALRASLAQRIALIDALRPPRVGSIPLLAKAGREEMIYGLRNQFAVPFAWDVEWMMEQGINPGNRMMIVEAGRSRRARLGGVGTSVQGPDPQAARPRRARPGGEYDFSSSRAPHRYMEPGRSKERGETLPLHVPGSKALAQPSSGEGSWLHRHKAGGGGRLAYSASAKATDAGGGKLPASVGSAGQVLIGPFLDKLDAAITNEPTRVRCEVGAGALRVHFVCEATTTTAVSNDRFVVVLAPDASGHDQLRFDFHGRPGVAGMQGLVRRAADNDWQRDVYWPHHSNLEAEVTVGRAPELGAAVVSVAIPLDLFACAVTSKSREWRANFVRYRKQPDVLYVWQPALVYQSKHHPPLHVLGTLMVPEGTVEAIPSPDATRRGRINRIVNGDFEAANATFESRDGWWGFKHFNGPVSDEGKQAIAAMMDLTIVDDPTRPGNRVAAFRTGEKAERFRNADGRPIFSVRIRQVVNVSESWAQGVHCLAFRARGTELYDGHGWNGLTLRVEFRNRSREATGPSIQRRISVSGEWRTFREPVVPPAGTDNMQLDFVLYGSGEVFVDDVELRAVP